MENILKFKKKFDSIFISFLKKELNNHYIANKDFKKNINQIMNLAQEGKRIRPFSFYIIIKSFNKKINKEILNIAIALEVLHLFALIQDDFMDKAKTRRGILTINEFIYKNNKVNNKSDKKHYANSQTILLSDLLFNMFYRLILNQKKEIQNQFYRMVKEVILGQYLDLYLANSKNINPSIKLIKLKTNLKTSYYTFVRPMIIGCVYCNLNQNIKNNIEKIGCLIGEVFQIQDDLFDFLLDKKTNKDKFNDIKGGQKTYITFNILKNKKYKKIFKKLFYKNLNNKEKLLLQKILFETKTLDFINKKLIQKYNQANKLINELKNNNLKKELLNLLNLIYKRNG